MSICCVCRHATEHSIKVSVSAKATALVCSDVCQAIALGNSGRRR